MNFDLPKRCSCKDFWNTPSHSKGHPLSLLQHPQHLSPDPLQPEARLRRQPLHRRRPGIRVDHIEHGLSRLLGIRPGNRLLFSRTPRANCRLKRSMVARGSETGLPRDSFRRSLCLPNPSATFSNTCGSSVRIFVLTFLYDTEISVLASDECIVRYSALLEA